MIEVQLAFREPRKEGRGEQVLHGRFPFGPDGFNHFEHPSLGVVEGKRGIPSPIYSWSIVSLSRRIGSSRIAARRASGKLPASVFPADPGSCLRGNNSNRTDS